MKKSSSRIVPREVSFVPKESSKGMVSLAFKDPRNILSAVRKSRQTNRLIDDFGKEIETSSIDMSICFIGVRAGWQLLRLSN